MDEQEVPGGVAEADDAYVVVVGVEYQISRLGFAPGDGLAVSVLLLPWTKPPDKIKFVPSWDRFIY